MCDRKSNNPFDCALNSRKKLMKPAPPLKRKITGAMRAAAELLNILRVRASISRTSESESAKFSTKKAERQSAPHRMKNAVRKSIKKGYVNFIPAKIGFCGGRLAPYAKEVIAVK